MPEAAARRESGDASAQTELVYQPAVIGLATMRYLHKKSGIEAQEPVAYLLWPEQIRAIPAWSEAEHPELSPRDLDTHTYAEARFAEVPAELSNATQIKALEKDFADYLYRNHWLVVSYNPSLEIYALPENTERDFKARCQEAAREGRDAETEKLKDAYESKIKKIEDRIRREEQELEEDRIDYQSRKQEELLSAGESLLGLLGGRKSSRALSTASRRRRMTKQAKADIDESVDALEELKKEIEELQEEMQEELDEVTREWAEKLDDIEELKVTPRRTDVGIEVFGLAWAPAWAVGGKRGRGRMIPAYRRAQAE